ncbi:MAG: hypothetical protein KGZ58_02920 [Ignavibacteriales bacterium]|nr:hypothetical protein [Ignavibacteriales bacterium]
MHNYIYTLDIAHPPVSSDEAEVIMQVEVRKIRNSSSLRVLKIIHGYGSGGRGGTLKTTIRNWLFENRSSFRCMIDGEQANIYNEDIQQMLRECGHNADTDLRSPNRGITIVWVK